MRIDRLDVRGYRRLRGEFSFDSALTIVSGPNEAGKSTLHDALVRSLFGFSPAERQGREGSSVRDLQKPWAAGAFGLTLHAYDNDGRAFVVNWDYLCDLAQCHDALTGEEILREQPKRRGDYRIGEQLVGVRREEFTQVCCLYQEALGTVAASETLHAALARSVESAPSEDIGVLTADARLKKLLASLGINSGHYGETAGGELARLRRRAGELNADLESARRQQTIVEELAVQRDAESHRCDELVLREAALTRVGLRTNVEQQERRLTRARELAAEAAQRPGAGPPVQRELIGRESTLRNELARADEQAHAQEAEIARRAADVAAAETALAQTQASLADLRAYARFDARNEDTIRACLAPIQAARQEADELQPLEAPSRDPELARFREASARPTAGEAAYWNGFLLLAGLLLTVAGVMGAALVNPILALLSAAGVACGWVARPRKPIGAVPDFGGRSPQELEDACAEEDRTQASFLAQRDLEARRNARVDERLAQLAAELGSGEGDLLERAELYLRQCEGWRKFKEAASQEQSIITRLAQLHAPAARLDEINRERAIRRDELRGLYREAAIALDDLAHAGEAFAQLSLNLELDERLRRGADAAGAKLAELLGEETTDDLQRRLDAARAALGAHDEEHGIANGSPSGDETQSLDTIRDELHRSQLEIARLRTLIDEHERGMRDVADLEVELAAVNAHRERIELVRDATQIARESLQKAAKDTHRRVAPHLNEALRRELPRITRGRYEQATVNENLEIKLYAPESGKLVAVEALSRGTRDQIALIQRLEIARLLDRTAGLAPLLLDDPFAHFDAMRLRLGAELIAEIAQQRQVVLFTDKAAVVETMQDAYPECTHIELPDPVDGAVLAASVWQLEA